MNIAEASAQLLTNFSPEERSVPDSVTYPGRNAAVKAALNSAFQELFAKGKPWVRTDSRGVVLNAPTAVTIAVTNGSKAGTITGWAAWMGGCTIVIDGAAIDNEIRNASSTVSLKYPYSGTSGTKTATVYHNSISLDTDVLEVHGIVKVDRRKLAFMANPQEFTHLGTSDDYGFSGSIQHETAATTAGAPVGYCVHAWSPTDAVTPPLLRVRLFPAPSVAGFFECDVMLAPPAVTDIASTTTLPVPFHFMESIFMPIATKKLRNCAFWRANGNDAELEADYQNALAILRDTQLTRNVQARFYCKG